MQWLMLQQEVPDDYVIATGIQYSVREFVEIAAKSLDISLVWQGEGVEEQGYDKHTGKCIVAIDPRYFRPTEVETLLGDPTKAKEKLGWQPRTPFAQLVEEMVMEDLKLAKQDALCRKAGFKTFDFHE
jgi:GDPmannose 4,6-dehydratase